MYHAVNCHLQLPLYSRVDQNRKQHIEHIYLFFLFMFVDYYKLGWSVEIFKYQFKCLKTFFCYPWLLYKYLYTLLFTDVLRYALPPYSLKLIHTWFLTVGRMQFTQSFLTLYHNRQNFLLIFLASLHRIEKLMNVHIKIKVNKWACEHMKKLPFFAIPNHRPPPLRFLPGIHVFRNQN